MVMPFWTVVGGFAFLALSYTFNPTLHSAGILTQWRPGDDTIMTLFKNMIDFSPRHAGP